MLHKRANLHNKGFIRFWVMLGSLTLAAMISGCLGNYGSLKRNPEVTKAFKENRVDNDYRYYYYGRSNQPHVVVGIDPDYRVESIMWREVDHTTDTFKDMIYWIWTDITFYYNLEYGADILDPGGKKVGLWYSPIWWAAVRFHEDNRIEIMPDIKTGGDR